MLFRGGFDLLRLILRQSNNLAPQPRQTGIISAIDPRVGSPREQHLIVRLLAQSGDAGE